jgi:hypothetical protein
MKVRLESGEQAEARGFDGNVLTLRSPRAFPPGSPIRFTVAVEEEVARSFEGRALGSRRADEIGFEVRMRFVSLRRVDREWLVARLGPSL